MRFKLSFAFTISVIGSISAQQNVVELNRQIYSSFDNIINKVDVPFHTAVKPYLKSNLNQYVDLDSLVYYDSFQLKYNNWFWRKSFRENLLIADTADFYVAADPLIDLTLTKDNTQGKNLMVFTRGARIKGEIGSNFAFYTEFLESQGSFPLYLEKYIDKSQVVPGQGRVKSFTIGSFKQRDYSMSEGYISYSPSKHFNVYFGHGKNFIGEGYRSLLLSDNAFNYPFLKLTTNFGIFQYTNIYASFINLVGTNNSDEGYPRKYGSFHYLSANVSKRLQIGLFEGIIWKNTEGRGFDFNYINPIILYRPVEFALGSPDNVIMGLNVKYKVSDGVTVYSQGVLDDINTQSLFKGEKGHLQQKVGAQLGVKFYDLFKIKKWNGQLEYNIVRPYVYAHKDALQAYTHHSQALAHPLGANFHEIVVITNYAYKNWYSEAKINIAQFGADVKGNYGNNIFTSDFFAINDENHPNVPDKTGAEYTLGHKFLDGEKNNLVNIDLRMGYIVNPRTNLNFFVGIQKRKRSSLSVNENDNFFYVGLRTNLRNQYFDF